MQPWICSIFIKLCHAGYEDLTLVEMLTVEDLQAGGALPLKKVQGDYLLKNIQLLRSR